jgi:hypothetical protein
MVAGGTAATMHPWQAIPRSSSMMRSRRYSERHGEARGSNSEDPPSPLAQVPRGGISRSLSAFSAMVAGSGEMKGGRRARYEFIARGVRARGIRSVERAMRTAFVAATNSHYASGVREEEAPGQWARAPSVVR